MLSGTVRYVLYSTSNKSSEHTAQHSTKQYGSRAGQGRGRIGEVRKSVFDLQEMDGWRNNIEK